MACGIHHMVHNAYYLTNIGGVFWSVVWSIRRFWSKPKNTIWEKCELKEGVVNHHNVMYQFHWVVFGKLNVNWQCQLIQMSWVVINLEENYFIGSRANIPCLNCSPISMLELRNLYNLLSCWCSNIIDCFIIIRHHNTYSRNSIHYTSTNSENFLSKIKRRI